VDVDPGAVEVLSFAPRSGRRLLASNLEVTVRIPAETPRARADIMKVCLIT